MSYLAKDFTQIWNSIEIQNLYTSTSYKRHLLTCWQLLKKLFEYFVQDLAILSGARLASTLVFKSQALNILKLLANEEDDNDV